jgi:hypothetical protein
MLSPLGCKVAYNGLQPSNLRHRSDAAKNMYASMQAILEDLTESRQAQQAAKVVQRAHVAEHEKEDFERILRVNREKEAADAQLAAQARPPLLPPTCGLFGHVATAGNNVVF